MNISETVEPPVSRVCAMSTTERIRPVFQREETLLEEPPRCYLKPHEIKVKLYLRECKRLNVIPVSAFLKQPTKNTLQIRHYNIGPNGARALAAALLCDNDISYLDIEGNSIGSVGFSSIQTALKENPKITHLNVADNKLGSRGAELIGNLLSTNITIEVLNASRNDFRDHDAPVFAKIIKESHKLKELILSGNEFEEAAGSLFGNALASNEVLERLDLSWNNIRKKGAAEFSQGIKENVGLKKLNISFNGFGTEGTAFMGQALVTNRTLVELDISKNRITDIDVKIFSQLLAQNETLEILKIGDNLVSALGAMDILRAAMHTETSHLNFIDFGSTSVDQGFLAILEELHKVKDVTVKYGNVQNVYADRDMMPEPELPEVTYLGDNITFIADEKRASSSKMSTEKGKTYVVDGGSKSRNSKSKAKSRIDVEDEVFPEASDDFQTMVEKHGEDDGDAAEDKEDKTMEGGENGNEGGSNGDGSDNKVKTEEIIDHDDETLDHEVEAITGKPDLPKQEALVMERASVGTLTPDI